MTENTDARIRHIYERWHETVVGRDLNGLMALCAEDAILETPLGRPPTVAIFFSFWWLDKPSTEAGRASQDHVLFFIVRR